MSIKKVVGFVLAPLLLGGVAFTYLRYRQDMRAAQRRLDGMERRMVETACGAMEAAVRGEGKPLLSIHGSGGGFDQALDLAARQLGDGYRVIAPSRFGYLGTPLPEDATPRAQAEAFVCLLDALEVEQAAVMTSSAGGPSAVQLALNYPERVSALVMVSTAIADKELALPPRPVMEVVGRSDFAFWVMAHPLRPLAQRMFIPADYELAPADAAEVADLMDKLLPISPRADGLIADMYVTNQDPHANSDAYRLEALTVPTLVINAKDDPMANYADARAMSRRMPEARFVSIAEGGHVMAGSGERISEEIGRFLQTHLE
jgi:pimeloyl-ACP methyl ester carboxylesterase